MTDTDRIAQDLLNRIAADCVEVTTEHMDGNTLVQKICIKDTDRIAQMALEAGLVDYVTEQGQLITDYGTINEELRNFARLVAEDCAKFVEPDAEHRRHPHEYLGGKEGIELLDLLAKTIRARYSTD